MDYSINSLRHLEQCKAVLVESKYKVIAIEYDICEALVNKVDTYRKKNGKRAILTHRFGQWIKFPKEMIKWGKAEKTGTTNDWCVGDREDYTYTVNKRYITKEDKDKIVNMYKEKNKKYFKTF